PASSGSTSWSSPTGKTRPDAAPTTSHGRSGARAKAPCRCTSSRSTRIRRSSRFSRRSAAMSSAPGPARSFARRSTASIKARFSPRRPEPPSGNRPGSNVVVRNRNLTQGAAVILHKFWAAFVAQINKVANLFWEADPVAQMRYEYDRAVEQVKEGRPGIEQTRGLVKRDTRQVNANRSHVQKLEAETKAYLKVGDRTTAAKFALELQKAKDELAANEAQLQMHETAYGNNL